MGNHLWSKVYFDAKEKARYRYLQNGNIFHYTSPEGLLGILREQSINLRFTRYDCVNDISEGEHILSVFKKSCDDLLKESIISRTFFDIISQIKLENKILVFPEVEDQILGKLEECTAYLCCFSLDCDSLPMWNYYVKNNQYQGYCIGFHHDLFYKEIHAGTGRKCVMEIAEVIYPDRKKEELIKSTVKGFYDSFSNETDVVEKIQHLLASLLLEWEFTFKPEYFSHEKEVRIVMYIPKTKKAEKDFPVEYQTKNGYIIPYILVQTEKKYLRQITIGPLSEEQLSHSTISDLINRRGYRVSGKSILNSKIPIRF